MCVIKFNDSGGNIVYFPELYACSSKSFCGNVYFQEIYAVIKGNNFGGNRFIFKSYKQ